MSILTILFLILLFIILKPLFRGFLLFRRYKKAVNDAYGQARAQQKQQSQQPAEPVHKKVFTKDMGEYVAYEEINIDSTTELHTDEGDMKITTEEQIVDVEWEEI